MEIFCRLLFGHLLADFTFQTNFIARWKRDSRYGLLVHVLLHPLMYIPLTWPYINDIWVTFGTIDLNGWMVISIVTFLHFVEDWLRVGLVNKGWPDNTLFYLWDQAVHLLVLYIFTPIGSMPIIDTWPLLGALFVGVTHFATVTVWFIEKDIFDGEEYPETEEKYISMLQRMVVWLFFFLPSPWWFVGPTFAIFIYGRHIWVRKIDFSWTSVILGNGMAVAAGLVARFVLGYHF